MKLANTRKHEGVFTVIIITSSFSQFELVGDFGSNVFEANGCATDPFKANSVETEPGEFANFHFPLNQRVCIRIPVNAKQKKSLSLLVIAVVRVQYASIRKEGVGCGVWGMNGVLWGITE